MSTIKVIKGSLTLNIPQKDESFINITGDTIDLDKVPQMVILSLTNINAKLLTKFDLPDILTVITYIREKYPNYNAPIDIYHLVNKYITDMFSQSFWTRLSEYKDCGYIKMSNRKFPYFHINDVDWKDANIRLRNQTGTAYPASFNGDEKNAVTSTKEIRSESIKNLQTEVVDLLGNLNINTTDATAMVTSKIARPTEKLEQEYANTNFHMIDVLQVYCYPDFEEYRKFIILLCKSGMHKYAIKLLCILPLTYLCCGVIKCQWYWNMWRELIFNEPLKNYIIYYAMYILKLEEIKSYHNVILNSRYVFTHSEAYLISTVLPKISLDKHALVHLMEPLGFKSSYMPLLIEGERKINSIEVFKQRLSIATDALLDNIDLSKYKAVLTGSILIPCIVTNPLEKRFEKITTSKKLIIDSLFDSIISDEKHDYQLQDDFSFKVFLECYYPSYLSVKNEEYPNYFEPKQTPEEYEIQKNEDLTSNHNGKPDDIERAVGFGVISDLDISIHTATFEEFKKNVYELFEDIKKNAKSRNKTEIYIRRIKRGTYFKYSMYGPDLIRPVDLFWITKSPDTFVEQFHLGVVRMHWNSHDLHIMQSCLAALLTGINHDYRWISCNKAPATIIIKYAQRGYTTPLNRNERPVLVEYLKNKLEWKNSLMSENRTIEYSLMYGLFSENHIFFMPDATKSGIRYGLKDLGLCMRYNPSLLLSVTNNNRLTWLPVNAMSGNIELHYYNSSRNSVGVPNTELLDKIIEIN